ncbi:MAG TPA: transporter [Gemmataceae bacterium]|nr:transporter [Gemmataceae bacterium]
MDRSCLLAIVGLVFWTSGCASLHPVAVEAETVKAKDGEGKENTGKKPPKTLLEWTLLKKDDEKKNGKNEEDGKKGKDRQRDKDKEPGNKNEDGVKDKENSNGEDKEKEEEPKRIDPDRPHLPEASTTVGLGRAVLEGGYTYNTSGGFFPRHSYPEALLRVGVFADWFEFRIAQNLATQTATDEFGVRSSNSGAQDLQLGAKLALTEQQQCLPESALILQMTVPTGNNALTANRVLPGVHYDCNWEIFKDLLSVETVVIADGAVDDRGHTFISLAHGVTAAYDVTKKLEAFGELDSFYASGDSAPPQHYFVAGLVYFITINCEIDVRAGVGLNEHADGYLIGSGFALRY